MSHKRSKRARRERRPSEPNYLQPMLARATAARAAGALRPGTLNHINVYHDGWCARLNGRGPCNCNPEVRLADDGRAARN